MKLTLAYSPCPNDTFIFDALVHGRIDTRGYEFEVVLADVETLNGWAFEGLWDITKLSYHALAYVLPQYRLLDSGSALGWGVGPLVISKNKISEADLFSGPVAIPGRWTTANLLTTLAYPELKNKKEVIYSDIEQQVLSGEVVAGVIIHENRFTYASRGLSLVQDLGDWWEKETSQPIPLGGIAANRQRLTSKQAKDISELIAESVRYAWTHPQASHGYVLAHAQEMDEHARVKHIETYVNKYSESLGEEGKAAFHYLIGKLQDQGRLGALSGDWLEPV
jgi:1,4-dihydroxy-6-naphthoate synthase